MQTNKLKEVFLLSNLSNNNNKYNGMFSLVIDSFKHTKIFFTNQKMKRYDLVESRSALKGLALIPSLKNNNEYYRKFLHRVSNRNNNRVERDSWHVQVRQSSTKFDKDGQT